MAQVNRISAHGKGMSLIGMTLSVVLMLLTELHTTGYLLFAGSIALFVVFWQLGWSPDE